MEPTPPVSVVIPCYNHARFLGEAVQSALNQTHPSVEVVVVDDGSTDDSAQVAERYPGVHLIRQPNLGLPAARNTGMRSSTGGFLIFLDADDRLLPEAAETGLSALHGHPEAAFAVGSFRSIDHEGRLTGVARMERIESNAYEAMLRRSFIPMHATALFRREAMELVGGYDESLPACEDYDLYLRLTRCFPIRQHATVVAEYRGHAANLSRDKHLIVDTALAVLGRQWPNVKDDALLRAAFNDGVRFWITAYANDTVWPAAGGYWLRGGRGVWRGALVLLRHVPRWFLDHTAARWRRRTLRTAGRILASGRRRLHISRAARPSRRTSASLRPRAFPPPVGLVRFGDLRCIAPVDRNYGYWRGWPVDRHYIEGFLVEHSDDIQGHVLEIKDSAYTRRFGGARVTKADVLDLDAQNPLATFVADLVDGTGVPSDTFDCVILTQTLHIIYDVRAALATVHRILSPGGVVLTTVPGITKADVSWYWSFTAASAQRLFEELFPPSNVQVQAYGNLLAAVSFLEGLAVSELTNDELDFRDPEYPVCIAVRAVKPGPSL